MCQTIPMDEEAAYAALRDFKRQTTKPKDPKVKRVTISEQER